jgi:hypothetical protein
MTKGIRIPRIGGLSGDIRLVLHSWLSLLNQLDSAVDNAEGLTRPGSVQFVPKLETARLLKNINTVPLLPSPLSEEESDV